MKYWSCKNKEEAKKVLEENGLVEVERTDLEFGDNTYAEKWTAHKEAITWKTLDGNYLTLVIGQLKPGNAFAWNKDINGAYVGYFRKNKGRYFARGRRLPKREIDMIEGLRKIK